MTQQHSGLGHFEPEVTHVVLPGCRACGGVHPLARKPVQPAHVCPDCGAAQIAPGNPVAHKARFSGFSPTLLLARLMLFLGKLLSKLSKRI